MSRMLSRRLMLGAGELLAVMLLVAAAAGLLATYHAERAEAERRAEDREAGRVFALWFQAAHRASQDFSVLDPAEPPGINFTDRVAGGGFLLTPAELRGLGAVPPGLPETAGRLGDAPFTLGIIDDGDGVPMAFGVLEPEEWEATASLREGALEAGLAQLEDVSGTDPETQARVAAIETVLARAVDAENALFVTADRGVRYEDRVLYRRAQPGQPRLNRMETDLDASGCRVLTGDPCDLLDGGPVAAEELQVSGDGTVGGEGTVATRTSVGEAGSPTSLSVGTPADPAAGTPAIPGALTAVEVEGPELTVAAHLVVGSAVAHSAVVTDGMTVFVDAARPWTGRAEAGAVDAAALTAQGDFTIEGAATVTGVSSVGALNASDLRASSRVSVEAGGSGSFQGLYGPRATIQNLTVVGSCAGCYSP